MPRPMFKNEKPEAHHAMTDTSSQTRLPSRTLSHRKPTRFRLHPGQKEREALAVALELQGLPALHFEGEIAPAGRTDFVLTAQLTAEAVQSCIVTLAPVPARIAETVTRRYMADLPQPTGDEVEMPEDDSMEPLTDVIDLETVMAEALALALPLYPRAPGAELGEAVFAAPGTAPLRDADLKPFAALAGLAGKVKPEGG